MNIHPASIRDSTEKKENRRDGPFWVRRGERGQEFGGLGTYMSALVSAPDLVL
jgi:hypothetical protein